MRILKFLPQITAGVLLALSVPVQALAEQASRVILASEVQWEALNPARGDNSPRAGTLWGDRKAAVPTGFLAKFKDGFSSPPHIHNASYRAVVISGLIHNDDPAAAHMWMPAGSFWAQPQGESHITAAKGAENIALVEIDKGPYLVHPPEKAFDNGERPINVDAGNIVWVDLPADSGQNSIPQIAYLWGELDEGQSHGVFIKLPAGFKGSIRSEGSTFHAVVITGSPKYFGDEVKTLEPGSYFGSEEAAMHPLKSGEAEETVLYVRTNGAVSIER